MARSLTARMAGAARLDVETYEEVEADATATSQAAIVVGLVAVAQAIGASGEGTRGIVAMLVVAFASWVLWAGVTYGIGTVLGGTATWGELLRTLGFAQAPGVLHVFGSVPLLGGLISGVVVLWILVAGVIAIRQALDFGTGRALLTGFVGWLALAIPLLVLHLVF